MAKTKTVNKEEFNNENKVVKISFTGHELLVIRYALGLLLDEHHRSKLMAEERRPQWYRDMIHSQIARDTKIQEKIEDVVQNKLKMFSKK